MKITILACLAVATPVSHGQTPSPVKRVVIGMPIYTADGARIGARHAARPHTEVARHHTGRPYRSNDHERPGFRSARKRQ